MSTYSEADFREGDFEFRALAHRSSLRNAACRVEWYRVVGYAAILAFVALSWFFILRLAAALV